MIYVLLGLLGLCAGSFIDATVWRLHQQASSKSRSPKKQRALSITKGRSMCNHCEHTLAWYDLIPLFSWLSLRGKCRYCHKSIGWECPVVELLTAGLFILSYAFWPHGLSGAGLFQFIVWLLILTGLVGLALYDLKWMLLPNRLLMPLIVLGVVQASVLFVWHPQARFIIDALTAVAIGGGLFYVLFQVSNGRWIGGGDVKLGFLIGLVVLQPSLALLTLFIASILGTLYALPLMALKRLNKSAHIPFGPFLIAATIIVELFGLSIIAWYKRQFLII